jgi:hypothetical protein
MANEFSVYQFFKPITPQDEGLYERVRSFVSSKEAVEAFVHFTTSVGARMGFVERVIITDGGDSTVAEWTYGKGITFPLEAQDAPD